MRIICFLRDAGISINGIAQLFADEHPEKTISVLMEQQERQLREELAEGQKKLSVVEAFRREIREISEFTVESIDDIAYSMKQKHKLRKMRWMMVLTGIPVTALQWVSVILWITNGLWWLFAVWACAAILWGIGVSAYYFRHVNYICPECHTVFRSRIKEVFWAYHTLKMRRLTCPHCGRRGMCVEVYTDKEKIV